MTWGERTTGGGLPIGQVAAGELVRFVTAFDLPSLPKCGFPRKNAGAKRASVYTPEETEVIAQERLIIQGKYLTVRRWCCGGTHYFRQHHCREAMAVVLEDGPDEPGEVVAVVRHHVVHATGGVHDCCPWCRCPDHNPRHAQRGTTLWVRAELAGEQQPATRPAKPSDPADPTLPPHREAFEEGSRRWWEGLDEATRNVRWRILDEDASFPRAARDDPLEIANRLFGEPRSGLPRSLRRQWSDTIRRSLQERGLVS
jgi:hypothetical protein